MFNVTVTAKFSARAEIKYTEYILYSYTSSFLLTVRSLFSRGGGHTVLHGFDVAYVVFAMPFLLVALLLTLSVFAHPALSLHSAYCICCATRG